MICFWVNFLLKTRIGNQSASYHSSARMLGTKGKQHFREQKQQSHREKGFEKGLQVGSWATHGYLSSESINKPIIKVHCTLRIRMSFSEKLSDGWAGDSWSTRITNSLLWFSSSLFMPPEYYSAIYCVQVSKGWTNVFSASVHSVRYFCRINWEFSENDRIKA